jgi:hypothetical protein
MGTPLTLAAEDVQFGHYDGDTGEFIPEPQATALDSVQVTARRTSGSPDGPLPLFFGPVFGWNEVEVADVVSVGTKPRRHVMFALDRSGSMCFDTSGVQLESYHQDPVLPQMKPSHSGWYWFPELALKQTGYGWYARTAWFYATDDATGAIRTDFLPDHIRAHLEAGRYFNFRPRDYPTTVMSGWIKVPLGVTIHGRWGEPWHNWWADDYYDVISSTCGYARSASPVEPLQDTMDAACAFVDLLRAQDDRAGLVTFGWKASTDQILTSDFGALKVRLQSFVPCGATAEPDAMEAVNDELVDSGRADAFGQRVAVLLTDGHANRLHGTGYDNDERTYQFCGEEVTTRIHPTVAAAMEQETLRAGNGGVRIYCVTFGSDTDTAVHRLIARNTRGAFYYAADHQYLTDIFMDIFRRLPPKITR